MKVDFKISAQFEVVEDFSYLCDRLAVELLEKGVNGQEICDPKSPSGLLNATVCLVE